MTRVFVIHYPPLTDRKINLTEQLEKRGITAEWVEHWNKGDDFVSRVKQYTGTNLADGHLSCYLKRCYVYNKMITENINDAIILEDDVIIDDEFDHLNIPSGFFYLRLGLGLACRHPEYWGSTTPIEMSGDKIYQILNPGGGEAAWVTQHFAQMFLKQLNFTYAHDLSEFGFMRANMFGIPVCKQFEFESSMVHTDGTNEPWINVIYNYYKTPTFNWHHMCSEIESSGGSSSMSIPSGTLSGQT